MWLIHHSMVLFTDNHCHLGVSCTLHDVPELAKALNESQVTFCLMSTNQWDLALVDQLSEMSPNVVPYFGVHPWYSHLFSANKLLSKTEHYNLVLNPKPSQELLGVLPEPIFIDDHLALIRLKIAKCEAAQRKYGIGEIGLDKLFRVPSNGFYGNQQIRENVSLTACKVTMAHQLQVLGKQLELAQERQKPVSLHCVKAHGVLFETVRRYLLPATILHSYTGSIEQAQSWVREYKKRLLLFSFSNYINGTKLPLLQQLVLVLDDSQILLETDMPLDVLVNSETEYMQHLHGIFKAVTQFKQWEPAEAERTLQANSAGVHR